MNAERVPSMKKVAVFGGSGFIGSTIVHHLTGQGCQVVSFSRKGVPAQGYLDKGKDEKSNNVKFVQADALLPDSYKSELNSCDALVIAVGTPPVPTFTKAAYEAKVKSNGQVCDEVIKTAMSQGSKVQKLLLISAAMPFITPKGFYDGKMLAESSAKKFSESAANRSVAILRPGPVSGTRYEYISSLGKFVPVPLGYVYAPFTFAMSIVRGVGVDTDLLNNLTPVDAERIGALAAFFLCSKAPSNAGESKFKIFKNIDIIKFDSK